MRPSGNQALLKMMCNTGDGVFIVGPDQRIIGWNRGAERILKHRESEVLNKLCYEVIDGRTHPNQPWCRAHCRVRECALSRTPLENFDLSARTKEGRRIWTNVSIIWVSGTEPISVHLIRDISTQRRVGEATRRFLADLGVPAATRIDRAGAKNSVAARSCRRTQPDPALLLSAREIEVLRLLAEGLSTQAVADKLNISRFTARNHTQNLVAKLGVHNKIQAVSLAFSSGLV